MNGLLVQVAKGDPELEGFVQSEKKPVGQVANGQPAFNDAGSRKDGRHVPLAFAAVKSYYRANHRTVVKERL
jgi:hypothetical protein